MAILQKVRLSPGAALRMFADAALLQVALIVALVARYIVVVVFQDPHGDVDLEGLFNYYLSSYCYSTGSLTGICLVLFYLNGFYTYSRYYQSRYKVLVVIQTVSLGYLLFAFLSFFFAGGIPFPRGGILLAWLLSLGLLVAARVWTQLWVRYVLSERAVVGRRRAHSVPRILVIGGAGYIGSALLPKLLDRGYHVRLLDVLMFGPSPIEPVADHPNLEIIRGDFRHVEHVVEAMRDVESAVHLGAIVGDPACDLDEGLTIDVNLSATRMIAQLAKEAGVDRFIFASTCSVYGSCDEVLDEHSQVKPVSLYGNTKLASEQILLEMADERFQPTILRLATIYGLSGRTRFDLVVNLLTAQAKIDGEITVFGGDQWRPFVHVEDAAAALDKVLTAPKQLVANQIFNVGSNEQNYPIRKIVEMVHERVISAKVVPSDHEGDIRNYRVDFGKIRNLLDFRPQWTVEAGIGQVLEAIASGEVSDYRDVAYSNVEFLSREGTTHLARDNWARELIRELASQ